MLIMNARAKRQGIIWPVLILALCFGRPVQADLAAFVGSGCRLELRVQDMNETELLVEIRRAYIDLLLVGVSNEEPHGDRFFIRNCADEFKAKLVSMSGESVILAVPRDVVATLEVQPATGTAAAALKARDIDAAASQNELARQTREMDVFNAVFGSLHGRMLVNGRPYAGCNVKVVRLDTGFMLSRSKQTPEVLYTTTDEQGVYRFDQLREGPYDIYWMPPGRNYWLRQLKAAPAVVVRAGAKVVQPDINADMRVM